eukprot:scaffold2773_cov119-Skeletonema_dohrnii-CCMP3373.AAC.9
MKEFNTAKHKRRLQRYYGHDFADTVGALSLEFNRELESPTKPTRRSVISKPPKKSKANVKSSLKKKKSAASSGRGKFGKLPSSTVGAENNNGNSDNVRLGVSVKKTFQDEDSGKPRLFYGIVTAHNAKNGLYKVSYEDGDEEEVTPTELEEILASKFNDGSARGGTKKRKRKRPKAKKAHSVLENV